MKRTRKLLAAILAITLSLTMALAPVAYAQNQPPLVQKRTKDTSFIKLGLGIFAGTLAAALLIAHGVRAAASKGKSSDATKEIKGRVAELSADSLTVIAGKDSKEQRWQFAIKPETRIRKPPVVGEKIKVRFQGGRQAGPADGASIVALEIK
jgi:hypothetical protein